jgi:AcrR family transcriptional regulator
MTEIGVAEDPDSPDWRQRAVARSLNAARSRAEQRIQRFLDAAFALMDEKGSTEFTIQEVIDRSKQSMRGFYQYFDGKDELLLALFEETIREATDDLGTVIETQTDPMDRLRAFIIRLHEWCEPSGTPRKRGSHNRRPINEFSVQLTVTHPDRVQAAMAPLSHTLVELLDAAGSAGAIEVKDTRHTATLMQQTVMYSWLGNRLTKNPRKRVTAEETWEFCLHGLRG